MGKNEKKVKMPSESFKEKNIEDSKNKILIFLTERKDNFSKICTNLEEYRRYFKNSFYENNQEYNDKLKEFNQYSKKFNSILDNFLEEVTDLPDGGEIGKLLLEMLTFMLVAQAKNTRIHTRIHKNIMIKSQEQISRYEIDIKSQRNNLRNIYTGFISIIAVFLSIFTLVSANINFFGNIIKVEDTLKKVISLFILVNSVTVFSLITLIGVIYLTIAFFNDKKVKLSYLLAYVPPILLFVSYFIIIA